MKGFVEATEQDFARLLALQHFVASKQSETRPSSQTLEAMRHDLHARDALLEKAADDLFRIHGELKFAKLPRYDLNTATAVLLTGTYPLPRVVQDRFVQKEPVLQEEETILYKTVENLIRVRLICTEQLSPACLRNISIDKGKLVWNVDDTFEIILRLPSEQSAWNVMTLNILIAQPELEKQGWINPWTPYIMHNITMKAQCLLDQNFKTGLAQVFSFLSKLAKKVQMEFIISQIEFLSQTSWLGNLRLEKTTDDDSRVRLFYWTQVPRTRHYLEFKLESDMNKNQDLLTSEEPHEKTKSLIMRRCKIQSDEQVQKILGEEEELTLCPKSLNLEELLYKITRKESCALLSQLSDLLQSNHDLTRLDVTVKGEDLVIIHHEENMSLRLSVDKKKGCVRCFADDGLISLSTLRIMERRVNENSEGLHEVAMYYRYARVLGILRNLLEMKNVFVVEESNLNIQGVPEQIINFPKGQKHVIYLGFKRFPGQFLAIAVAGVSHWEVSPGECQIGSLEPQLRLFMVNADASDKGLVFVSTRPLKPFSILKQRDLISDSRSLSPLINQVLDHIEIQLIYREFAMDMMRTRIRFSFVSSTDGLYKKPGTAQNIPLILADGSFPKIRILIDDISKSGSLKTLLGNMYVYLINMGNGSYHVGGKMRINLQRLPNFDNDAFDATDWDLNKEEGYIEFNHERFDCYAKALLDFITSFSNMCILASKFKRMSGFLETMNICLGQFKALSLDLRICKQILICHWDLFSTKFDLSLHTDSKWPDKSRTPFLKTIIGLAQSRLASSECVLLICESLSLYLSLSTTISLVSQKSSLRLAHVIPHTLDQYRIYLMEKYAIDIRIFPRNYIACQDAYYPRNYPANHLPFARPPTYKNGFAKFKPIPQMQPVPGMTMLISLSTGSNNGSFSATPMSHGFVCRLDALKPLTHQLQKLSETLSVLSEVGKELEKLKNSRLIESFTVEEGNMQMMWTTQLVKSAISVKGIANWQVFMVPHKADIMEKFNIVAADGKPFSDVLSSKMTNLSRARRPHEFAYDLVKLSCMPMLVIRDFINITKWETNPTGSVTRAEWVLHVSQTESISSYVNQDKNICFCIDARKQIIKLVMRFYAQSSPVESTSSVYIPLKYNYSTGVINVWRPEPDNSDLTALFGKDLKDKLQALGNSRHLATLSFVERIFAQATIKEVPLHLGGPGKLFVVIKHLSSKPIQELQFY